MRLRANGWLMGLLLMGFGTAWAVPPILEGLEFPPLVFQPPKAKRVTLSNGMPLYLMEDHELPVFQLIAYVRAGDVYDPPDKVGLAALTAEVLRTGGTTTRPPEEMNETLEFIAGVLESSMDLEYGTVVLNVLSKDLELGIELFADVIRNPAFREDKFQLARNRRLEAVRRQNDTPVQIALRLMYQNLYPNHPYGYWETVQTLQAIRREDLIAYHRRFYRPDTLWLAASGDFDPDRLIQLLESAFANWQVEPEPIEEIPPLPDNRVGVFHAEKELNQTTIVLAHHGVRRTNPDWTTINVMNDLLGGSGFTSRLMREVRTRRGLAYAVGSAFVRRNLPGPFYAYCLTKAESTVQAIQAMLAILRGMREEPVTEEELDVVKNAIVNSFIFAFTSSAQVAEQQLRLDFFGYPPDYLDTFTEKTERVTREDVLRVAREYLNPDRLTIVTVGQRSRFDGPLESIGPVTVVPLEEESAETEVPGGGSQNGGTE